MSSPRGLAVRQRARNEILFREVNEKIREVSRTNGGAELIGLCECGRQECLEQIDITRTEYELVRAQAAWFIVVPGHAERDIEHPVKVADGHLVVEKTGLAGELAERRQSDE